MKKILVPIIFMLACEASAADFYDIDSANVDARIGDRQFPSGAVDLFYRLAVEKKPDTTRRQMLEGLIENHLIARYVEQEEASHREHGEEGGGHDHGSRVQYSEETILENELFKLARSAFGDEIAASLKAAGVDSHTDFLLGKPVLDRKKLKPALELKNRLYHMMTDEQEGKARQLVIASYQFPGEQRADISLWDIYSRQNIQLKVQMHEYNFGFIEQAINQYLATRYVLYWLENKSGLEREEYDFLVSVVREKHLREVFMHENGLMADIHDENPELKRLMGEVSQAEIEAYYNENKEQFIRVEKVRARHIRLESQKEADRVYRELKEGLDFAQAVKKYSTAKDKKDNPTGDLGWINREDRNNSWLKGLSFVQKERQPSPPFRSPQKDKDVYWEIVYLDEKVTGYQPVDSEGVRYIASQEIARKKMVENFRRKVEDIRQGADVHFNVRYRT